MTDGPCKNLNLPKHWKQFTNVVENDAFAFGEKCASASNALLREILTNENWTLIFNIQALCNREQYDLDMQSLVELFFQKHNKTPFADHLQREFMFRLKREVAPDVAFLQALEVLIEDQISKTKDRIKVEYIRANELGELKQNQMHHIVTKSNSIFDALDKGALCEAVRTGNKKAFKNGVEKQTGIDQGPGL